MFPGMPMPMPMTKSPWLVGEETLFATYPLWGRAGLSCLLSKGFESLWELIDKTWRRHKDQQRL